MTNPYGDAADLYWNAGWRGILPLPYQAKKNPPAGYTGSTGTDPAYPDVATWADGNDGERNICLRLPANVVGIDVDAYGGKEGAATLAAREQQWGVLPPTWRTTSRDDGTSGIRLYRVPEGLAWPGIVGPGIETVRRDHRYAVVWPSIHPEGGTYRWINPHGVVTTNTVPDPDELPMLPDAWVMGLTQGQAADTVERNNMAEDAAMLWIVGLEGATRDDPCRRMTKAVSQAKDDLTSGASAHDATTAAVARALRLGDEGHRGAVAALNDIRSAFTAEVTRTDRTVAGKTIRTKPEADREWRDIVRSGVNFVSASPADLNTCDCDGQLTDTITATPPAADTAATADTPRPPQMRDGATFILDAPDTPPAIWGYGQKVLWSEGESCMIVGPPGVGKTTVTGQVVRARLGLTPAHVIGYGITPTSSKVLYLAMDRPSQIARSLRRHFTEDDREVLADRLIVWQGPPPYDLADNPDILLSLCQLAGADTVVIDSVKDAAVGLSDDETGAGYNRARQKVLAAGVEVMELHHQTKRGPNGAAPKQLADVYGSAWITAGAGSVVLLWGQAGDPVVQLLHLKQPAEDVGPLTLVHDHVAGTTVVDEEETPDLEAYLKSHAASGGMTAAQWAVALFGDADNNNKKKAARRLNDAVNEGLASVIKGHTGGATPTPNRYFPADQTIPATIPAGQNGDTIPAHSRPFPQNDKTAGQTIPATIPAIPAPDHSRGHPSLREGGAHAGDADGRQSLTNDLIGTCSGCGKPAATNPCSTCRARA